MYITIDDLYYDSGGRRMLIDRKNLPFWGLTIDGPLLAVKPFITQSLRSSSSPGVRLGAQYPTKTRLSIVSDNDPTSLRNNMIAAVNIAMNGSRN